MGLFVEGCVYSASLLFLIIKKKKSKKFQKNLQKKFPITCLRKMASPQVAQAPTSAGVAPSSSSTPPASAGVAAVPSPTSPPSSGVPMPPSPVAAIRVGRDAVTRRSLGYAYVNFHNVVDAERALDTLNYASIKGKACRIMWSHRDPSLRKSGKGNIFIKNLDKSIDNKALYDTFSTFGNILSCKVETDENGNSKGYGYVHYETDEAALTSIEKVNGMLLNGKIVYVGPFIPRKERSSGSGERKFTNVYVKNLDESVDDAELQEVFGKYGPIQNAAVMKRDGKSRGFGFVNFENPEDAAAAVEELNGAAIDGKEIYCGRAQKKGERESELREKFEQLKIERMNKWQGVNLYIKNLDDTVDEERLKTEFSQFGTITSCKIMRDEKENSKGFGFVCMSKPEEAAKAVTEMNGRMIGAKPVYVALAQRKEIRRQLLEAQHAQRAQGMRIGMQHPGAMGGNPAMYPGTPVFYPQNLPPQARQQGFVYPQQILPRPRWGAPQQAQQGRATYQAMPNYVVNVARGQRGGQTRRQNVPGQPQQNGRGPMVAPSAATRGRFKYTPNARNNPALRPDQVPVAVPIQPLPVTAIPIQPIQNLPADGQSDVLSAARLAQADPENREQLIGETLFPRIAAQNQELAGKITGMLLESMDTSELLQLLEEPQALSEKVEEAVVVLREHERLNATGQEEQQPSQQSEQHQPVESEAGN